jgi:hypothetical protein
MPSPVRCHKADRPITISRLAGKPAPKDLLVDLAHLEREYFQRRPDVDDAEQLVSFGTSGHRGSPFRGSFTEAHILAITQAICDYRRAQATDGPAVYGQSYACAFGTGSTPCARSAGRQRGADNHPAGQRRDADSPRAWRGN